MPDKKGDTLKRMMEDLADVGKTSSGKELPQVSPEKYGFKSTDEYWDYVRQAAAAFDQCPQYCPELDQRQCVKPTGHAGKHSDGVHTWTA